MQAWAKGYLQADDKVHQEAFLTHLFETDQDYRISGLETKLHDRQQQIEELKKDISRHTKEYFSLLAKMDKLEDKIDLLNDICGRTGDELMEERKRTDQLEEKIAEIMGMINDDRETIDIMWNAACMPGGQEAAEMAKVHWEDLANAE